MLLKRYYDLGRNVKFIVIGSSSLEIKSQVKESLTGRKRVFELHPISFPEYLDFKGIDVGRPLSDQLLFEAEHFLALLDSFIRFGGNPGVVKLDDPKEKELLLAEIYRSYVQKDISDFRKF